MRALALVLLLAAAWPATAQRTYAILSLVGDHIDIVQRVTATGSNVDRNRKDPCRSKTASSTARS